MKSSESSESKKTLNPIWVFFCFNTWDRGTATDEKVVKNELECGNYSVETRHL